MSVIVQFLDNSRREAGHLSQHESWIDGMEELEEALAASFLGKTLIRAPSSALEDRGCNKVSCCYKPSMLPQTWKTAEQGRFWS